MDRSSVRRTHAASGIICAVSEDAHCDLNLRAKSLAEQVLDHHLVEILIITVRDQLLRSAFIKRARLLNQTQKCFAAVVEMREPMFRLRRAKRMHVETNVFAF